MKASDIIIDLLVKNGVDKGWVLQGGAIAHIIDSSFQRAKHKKDFKALTVLHEQAASIAADAYSRLSDNMGSVMVTSGPGATNILTGLACSWYDSIPVIYLTGQVRTWELSDKSQRQLGFQETDIVSIVKSITKYAVTIKDSRDLVYEIEKAIFLARDGRPGPVLIDLPMDMQWAEIDMSEQRSFNKPDSVWDYSSQKLKKVDQFISLLEGAKKPVVISGAGVRSSGALDMLEQFVEKLSLPLVNSYGGKDTFSYAHSSYCGMIGMMGGHGSNKILDEADLIIAIGSRLSWRQVRSQPDKFGLNAKIVHIDIDPKELDAHVPANLSFDWDASFFLKMVMPEIENKELNFNPFLAKSKQLFTEQKYYDDLVLLDGQINPYSFIKEISKKAPENTTYVCDTGQNLVWCMQAIEIKKSQRLITAWGHSPMGYSICGSLGAYEATSKNKIICFIGDGGIQMNIQELQTIKHYGYPIIIFVMNNSSYGCIKDFQNDNLEGRYYGTNLVGDYSTPDFVHIAESYGIKSFKLSDNKQTESILAEALKSDAPVLVEVMLGEDTKMHISPIKE